MREGFIIKMKEHKYNNTVIQSKGGEHGKRVIEWWKKQGVDTYDNKGIIIGDFYGLINGTFCWYGLSTVKKANAKIIELPDETLSEQDWKTFTKDINPKIIDLSNVEGVEMIVSYDGKEWSSVKVVAKIGYFYIDSQGIVWKYTKPIEVKKVTMQEVEELFGCRVEIVKEVSNEQ